MHTSNVIGGVCFWVKNVRKLFSRESKLVYDVVVLKLDHVIAELLRGVDSKNESNR